MSSAGRCRVCRGLEALQPAQVSLDLTLELSWEVVEGDAPGWCGARSDAGGVVQAASSLAQVWG